MLAACLLLPLLALAPVHPDSFSRSQVVVGRDHVELALRVQVRSLAEVLPELAAGVTGSLPPGALEEADGEVLAYLGEHYRLTLVGAGGELTPLPPGAWSVAEVRPAEGELDLPGGELVDVLLRWPRQGARPSAVEWEVDLFLETSPRHRDLCQVRWFDERPEAHLFHGAARTWRWPPERPDPLGTLAAFARLGLAQLPARWPGAVVLLLLVLGASDGRGLLLRLGAFLPGQLVGLALGEQEAFQAPLAERIVELAHLLSVSYLAADCLLHGRGRRWVEPGLLGVVHGLALHRAVAGPLEGLYHLGLPLVGTWGGQALPLALAGILLGGTWLARTGPVGRGEPLVGLARHGTLVLLVGGLVAFGIDTLGPPS